MAPKGFKVVLHKWARVTRLIQRDVNIKRKLLTLTLILVLIVSFYLRFSVLGFSDIPIHASSLDTSLHISLTQHIAETGKIEFLPSYIAEGRENATFFFAPLLYVVPAILTKVFNIEAWNSIWLFVCLVSTLMVFFVYLFSSELFKSRALGLISASIVGLIPGYFIRQPLVTGMWNIVLGLCFLSLGFYLLYKIKAKPTQNLFILFGLCTALLFLSHSLDLLFLFPVYVFVLIKIWKKLEVGSLIKYHFLAFIPFLISALIFLPHLIFYWSKIKKSGFHLAPKITAMYPSVLELYHNTGLFDYFLILVALFIVSLILMVLNYKKNIFSLLLVINYFIFTNVLIFFVNEAEYFIKLRFFLPVIIAITAVYVIKRINPKILSAIVALMIILAIYSAQYYSAPVHMTQESYDVLNWIRYNTPKESSIAYIEGITGWNGLFARRVGLEVYNLTPFSGFKVGSQEGLLLRKGYLDYKPLERKEFSSLEELDYAVYYARTNVTKEVVYSNKEYKIVKIN
jgi:hypothetical protein